MNRSSDAKLPPAVQPWDEHNQRLVAQVHPTSWQNPVPQGRYNLVVIGAGTAGLVTAAGAAGLGAKVALVEAQLMGGDCLNVGCVPSKALLRSARALADVRGAEKYGVQLPGEATIDFPAVMERMRRLRAELSAHDSATRFRELGVDVYLGAGRFVSTDRLEVAGQTLHFARACIATGSRPNVPDVPGLEEAGYLTNETLFSLAELPRRLAIVGGGPIGCEMAQAFARFGSEVHLIEHGPHLLSREDREAAAFVEAALARVGFIFHLQTKLVAARRHGYKKQLMLETNDRGRQEISADQILVATGRTPNVAELGLQAAGVAFDSRHGVEVNDYLQTTNRRIYAAGDVCSKFKFTHVADALARIAIQNALFFGRAKASALTIPWCTYTDPEVAHVGLGPDQLQQQGIAFEALTVPLSAVDRAHLDGTTAGLLKVYIKRRSDQLLGATLVAPHAGEMISGMTLALASKMGLKTLARTIHPYPTQAEIVKKAADQYNRGRLTPVVQRALRAWFRWRR